jgi:hypothetical protein
MAPPASPPGTALERWRPALRDVEPSAARAPIGVLVGEAIELSCFIASRWEPEGTGDDEVPGMRSAAEAGSLAPTVVADLRDLALALAEAHAELQLTEITIPEAPVERGKAMLAELRQSLAFLFDDGVIDDRDGSLTRLTESHTDTSTHDALALSLEGFAFFAHEHRKQLAKLPGFDPAIVDDALEVGMRLRKQSAIVMTLKSKSGRPDALHTRNRLVTLLRDRVAAARRAARFVYRRHPDIAAHTSSSYTRTSNARSRARKATRRAASQGKAPVEE